MFLTFKSCPNGYTGIIMTTIDEIINQCSEEQTEQICLKLEEVEDIIKNVSGLGFIELLGIREYYYLNTIKSLAFYKQ